MERINSIGGFSLVTLALTLGFFLSTAGAQSEQDFFKGKTITVIAGSSAGGGTDSLARLLARHLGKQIPGNPKVVVTNMAGAAGLIAANHLYNRSPKDGTAIGTMATGLTFRTAKRDPALKLQLEKFTYLGQIASEGNLVYFRSESPFSSIEAIKKANKEGKKPKMGAQAKEHNSNVVPKAMEALLGIDVDVVYGYPGTAEILLDIERGALDGRAQSRGSLFATRSHWMEKNFIKVLTVTSPQRDSRLPNVPTLEELSPADKKPLLEAMYSVQGRTFAMPPDVPPERAKILRDAFAAMHKDPGFQKDVDKLGWNDELIRGEELNKKVEGLVHNEVAMGFFRKILQ
ncbi:MAG: Bug family tripartite tricarboxylate transporter substrate binding protein [Candidatus Binatia bacterium]